jgi:tetratricopeptide (TPR) repeat protein
VFLIASTSAPDPHSLSRFSSRVVAFDNEHGEAWNNLAAVHMQQKRLPLAMSALEQASRLMRDHWRVWDNMLTVAMQLNRYHKAIAALDRICELAPTNANQSAHQNSNGASAMPSSSTASRTDASGTQMIDARVVAVLARCVLRYCVDHPASLQWQHMQNLLARLCEKFTADAALWRVRADFAAARGDAAAGLDYATRAVRALQMNANGGGGSGSSGVGWDRDPAHFERLVTGLEAAVDFFGEHAPNAAARTQHGYFARLEIERVLVRAQNAEAIRQHEGVARLRALLAGAAAALERGEAPASSAAAESGASVASAAASAAAAAAPIAAPAAAAPAPAPVVSSGINSSLSDMMSMWR